MQKERREEQCAMKTSTDFVHPAILRDAILVPFSTACTDDSVELLLDGREIHKLPVVCSALTRLLNGTNFDPPDQLGASMRCRSVHRLNRFASGSAFKIIFPPPASIRTTAKRAVFFTDRSRRDQRLLWMQVPMILKGSEQIVHPWLHIFLDLSVLMAGGSSSR